MDVGFTMSFQVRHLSRKKLALRIFIFAEIHFSAAMQRFFFRFAVTTITILTVELLVTWITGYLESFRSRFDPYSFTLVSMGIITIIFYPLFEKMHDWVKSLSKKIIKSGKSAGGKFFGLLLAFLCCFGILFYFYLKMWYGKDLLAGALNF